MKFVLLFLLSVSIVLGEEQIPNPKKEEITIYLGPKIGSKILTVEEVKTPSDSDTEIKENSNPASVDTFNTKANVTVDLKSRVLYENNLDSMFDRKTLNLTGLQLTGDDVRKILHQLNDTVKSRLTRLDLSNNYIMDLPMFTFPMELEYGLEELRLNDNSYLNIGDPLISRATRFELSRLRNLKKLNLARCNLYTVEELELPPLKSLDLSGNRMIQLPSSFSMLTSLEELDLSGNKIRYINNSPYKYFTNLKVLNFSSNGLENIWDDPFQSLHSLETLHLENNTMSEPPKLYKYTGSYQPQLTVFLGGNPFKCGCAFANILSTDRVLIQDKANLTCVDSQGVFWAADTRTAQACSAPLESVKQGWDNVKDWFSYSHFSWDIVYRSLGWLLFGVTLGLLYAQRRMTKTSSQVPTDVPYNILSDAAAIH